MGTDDTGSRLLAIARHAIAARLGLPAPDAPDAPELHRRAATFVTLRTGGGELRGCIGSLEPARELGEDVRANALGAAFADPRFPPLTAAEFADTAIEVSLLTPGEPLPVAGETELAALLRPGVDGVTVDLHGRRATFLPQVWQALPDPREFLAALWRKAGLPEGLRHPQMRISRYQVAKWAERTPSAQGGSR